MTVKQISVFLENKPGELIAFSKLLEKNDINMHALSLADTEEFGILRIIVNDSYKAACVLKDEGYVFSINSVLAVEIPDTPGGLAKILDVLGQNNINIQYTYAFTTKKTDSAYMIFRVQDNEEAISVLRKNGVKLICQDELDSYFQK